MIGTSVSPTRCAARQRRSPGDQLEAVVVRPADQRLDDAVLLDGIDQLLEVVVAKNGARLERGRDDLA